MRGAEKNDTATGIFLDEGRATVGVWAPLALADLYAAVVALVRVMSANPDAIKVPSRSEALAGWCLPMLSKSIAADEQERDAIELLNSVKRLAAKHQK